MENKENNEGMDKGMCCDGKCEGKTCSPMMCGGMKHGDMCGGSCGCRCIHHKVKGVIVAVVGALIIAGSMGSLDWSSVGVVIGALIILAGLKKSFAGMCKCC